MTNDDRTVFIIGPRRTTPKRNGIEDKKILRFEISPSCILLYRPCGLGCVVILNWDCTCLIIGIYDERLSIQCYVVKIGLNFN